MTKRTQTPVDVYVGNRIRTRRHLLSMSQSDLAEKVGITFQQIQKYEKGVNRCGGSRLAAIATALETSVAFFFDGAPGHDVTDTAPDFTSVFLANSRGFELARLFAGMNAASQSALIATAEALAGHPQEQAA